MADEDEEEVENIEVDFGISIAALTIKVRDQLLKDARRLGNLYGSKAAQKKTPLASKPQVPGNRHVW